MHPSDGLDTTLNPVQNIVLNISGISNVKSREDLVMSNTDLASDPFGSAPFNPPSKLRSKF